MEKIKIGHFFIHFSKKRGLKNIRLRIDRHQKIILNAPFFCAKSQAVAFAEQNLAWIEKQISSRPNSIRFDHNSTITLLDQCYHINHNPSHRGGIEIQNDNLLVGGEAAFIHRRVSNYAKKQFLAYIQQRTKHFGDILGIYPKHISLKDTSSRWGSCSTQKNLNFCWKLAFAPIAVSDYIIAHEMAHLIEMNHGPRFWATVARLNVEQASAKIWLRKHGEEIQAIE